MGSDSFTILGLWVLGLTVSNINESQLQTYESKPLFLMTSLQYYCIPGLAEIDGGCAGNKITAMMGIRKLALNCCTKGNSSHIDRVSKSCHWMQ